MLVGDLGLLPTESELHRAFRQRARVSHPDKVGQTTRSLGDARDARWSTPRKCRKPTMTAHEGGMSGKKQKREFSGSAARWTCQQPQTSLYWRAWQRRTTQMHSSKCEFWLASPAGSARVAYVHGHGLLRKWPEMPPTPYNGALMRVQPC